MGVIGDLAWPRFGQKSNVGAVFPIASRKLRATFFFPSGSKFLPFGFEGHHKRVDGKLIEKWVRESFVQLRAALTPP